MKTNMKYTHIELPKEKRNHRHKIILIGFVFFVIAYSVVVLSIVFLSVERENRVLSQKLTKLSGSKNVSAKNETNAESSKQNENNFAPVDKAQEVKLLDKIQTLAIVPFDETPTLVSVADAANLKLDPIFANTQNGDVLVVYQQARLAILYRPTVEKLVNMANISGGEAKGVAVAPKEVTSSTSAVLKPKIAIYFATDSAQLRVDTRKMIATQLRGAQIVKEVFTRGDYENNIVNDVNGSQQEATDALIRALNATKGEIPSTEQNIQADIAIIIAK